MSLPEENVSRDDRIVMDLSHSPELILPNLFAGEKERRQSMLPNLSKSVSQKANYLTVPNATGAGGAGAGAGGAGGGGSGPSAGGMIKNAFNRLVSGNW